ncbi:unnamed protein product [Didymodactylos carnosus]|uniref:Uncharacterized protein n=1 Tax=Didymodactylos carnosus TaxID=1234261 RepID=A0A814W692_9BILA|nr:unnamed protein product [Didymodactylos carnosus]CAF1215732.1 unnamed protein product [Didymodactylos carnosus]CAF3961482.1 unnamed protein product [Didymodactylos carnosus]CAF4024204.1 unnamed protein product [Didymodactylos carnosus]
MYAQLNSIVNNVIIFDNIEKCSNYIRLKFRLSTNHPDIVQLYSTIGFCLFQEQEYDKALIYLEKTIMNTKEYNSLAINYSYIGSIYSRKKDSVKALTYFEWSLEMQLMASPLCHESLTTRYNNLGTIYFNRQNYDNALEYYEKAHEIMESGATCHNIGRIYAVKDEPDKALKECTKAPELLLKKPSSMNNNLHMANVYFSIGQINKNKQDYSMALFNYEKAFEIGVKHLRFNDIDLIRYGIHMQNTKQKLMDCSN